MSDKSGDVSDDAAYLIKRKIVLEDSAEVVANLLENKTIGS